MQCIGGYHVLRAHNAAARGLAVHCNVAGNIGSGVAIAVASDGAVLSWCSSKALVIGWVVADTLSNKPLLLRICDRHSYRRPPIRLRWCSGGR